MAFWLDDDYLERSRAESIAPNSPVGVGGGADAGGGKGPDIAASGVEGGSDPRSGSAGFATLADYMKGGATKSLQDRIDNYLGGIYNKRGMGTGEHYRYLAGKDTAIGKDIKGSSWYKPPFYMDDGSLHGEDYSTIGGPKRREDYKTGDFTNPEMVEGYGSYLGNTGLDLVGKGGDAGWSELASKLYGSWQNGKLGEYQGKGKTGPALTRGEAAMEGALLKGVGGAPIEKAYRDYGDLEEGLRKGLLNQANTAREREESLAKMAPQFEERAKNIASYGQKLKKFEDDLKRYQTYKNNPAYHKGVWDEATRKALGFDVNVGPTSIGLSSYSPGPMPDRLMTFKEFLKGQYDPNTGISNKDGIRRAISPDYSYPDPATEAEYAKYLKDIEAYDRDLQNAYGGKEKFANELTRLKAARGNRYEFNRELRRRMMGGLNPVFNPWWERY